MKTAVEWLECELGRRQSIIDSEPDGIVKKSMYANLYVDFFEQAKEMEKEQIIDAYAQGFIESERMDKGAEQYYNETFKTINNG
jgi:hypothetical protein